MAPTKTKTSSRPVRGTKKRPAPNKEHEDDENRKSKRPKLDGNESAAAKVPEAVEKIAWTEEECLWIRLYYRLLLHATVTQKIIHPRITKACTNFKAFYIGFMTDPTGNDPPRPRYSKRSHDEFRAKVYELEATTLQQLDQALASIVDSDLDEGNFRPIITFGRLRQFSEIYRQYAQAGEFNLDQGPGAEAMKTFFDNIISWNEPFFIANGQANIRRRSSLLPRESDSPQPKPEDERISFRHYSWHQDPAHERDPTNTLQVSYGSDKKTGYVQLSKRKIHAGAGNALLNAAIMRPKGYDGDLNALINNQSDVTMPKMNEKRRKKLDESLQVVTAGNVLRGGLFEGEEWESTTPQPTQTTVMPVVRKKGKGKRTKK
jgi:hypothetical protein